MDYIFDGKSVIGNATPAISSSMTNNARLWHLRLGHISQRGLDELDKQGLFKEKLKEKLDFCDECVLGKACKMKFGKGEHTTTEKLGYLHSDLWGPSRVATKGGAYYFMSIIDDYSRKVWIHLLKSKDQAMETFINWKKLLENQTGLKIKVLRTDNGLEYCSNDFNSYCTGEGILRHKTVARNPQQNGVAERMNRTLMERVRFMLLGAGLDRSFWGEALMTAYYLINRSPAVANNFMTPQEKWTGKQPDFNHLKVFGCTAFVHIKQDKLKARALRCLFLGYPEGIKGYKFWCLEDGYKKCLISRDVTFKEDEMAMKIKNSPNQDEKDETRNLQIEVDNVLSNSEKSIEAEESIEPEDNLRDYQLARDRQRREGRPPTRFGYADFIAYALTAAEEIDSTEPTCYQEAIKGRDAHLWIQAIEEEKMSLLKNNTWEIVKRPPGKKLVTSKWIFKRKEGITESDKGRYKARLVAKGFTQKEGVDFNEIFSPVVKQTSIRVMMVKAARFGLKVEQMDVRTAFLHGDLEEQIFMEIPEGFENEDSKQVCLLKKSLYGLKQAPRQWNLKFDSLMTKICFNKSEYDSCVYFDDYTYLLLYVDDILIIGKDEHKINEVKTKLSNEFEMKDLGCARRILGIEIKRPDSNTITLSQSDYIQKLLLKYGMSNCKGVSTPLSQHFKLSNAQSPTTDADRLKMDKVPYASCVGSLMYSMVCTQPDLAHAMSVVSRYISDPGTEHWEAVKWIMRYLKGSSNTGLSYRKNGDYREEVTGYVDSDFAANIDTRRSCTGYVFTVLRGCVSWKSNL